MTTLLHAWRRLDWRFLLPDPTLRHVAYLGPGEGGLLSALMLCSEALTIISADSEPEPDGEGFQLVVVKDPDERALKRAAGVVEPGGCLYLETSRDARRLTRAAAPRPSQLKAILGGLGFSHVRAFWHWPDFEACRQIIPLDDGRALAFAVERGARPPFGKILGAAAQALCAQGMFPRFLPGFSLTGRRSAEA